MEADESFQTHSKVTINHPFEIDSSVILGEIPGRSVEFFSLAIGEGARIRSGAVVYSSSQIGKMLETGHNVIIRESCIIGENVKIWNSTTVDYGCTIGSNVKIHTNVYLCQGTIIEDNVFIGPGVLFLNNKNPECNKCFEAPIVKKGARIGAGAIIMPAVIIGEDAIVGAGSVVLKNVPAGKMVYGNPAKIKGNAIKHVCKV